MCVYVYIYIYANADARHYQELAAIITLLSAFLSSCLPLQILSHKP